jgi:4-hydroxybenzoate polyprenyltransferase
VWGFLYSPKRKEFHVVVVVVVGIITVFPYMTKGAVGMRMTVEPIYVFLVVNSLFTILPGISSG